MPVHRPQHRFGLRYWLLVGAALAGYAAPCGATPPEYSAPASFPSKAYILLGILPDGNYGAVALDTNHNTQAPTVATTGYSGTTNAIGTSSTAITINGLAFSAANWKTVTLTNQTGCDIWINTGGGPAVASAGKEIANGTQYLFGYDPGYEMPTNQVTGIAVAAGGTGVCPTTSVSLAVEAR